MGTHYFMTRRGKEYYDRAVASAQPLDTPELSILETIDDAGGQQDLGNFMPGSISEISAYGRIADDLSRRGLIREEHKMTDSDYADWRGLYGRSSYAKWGDEQGSSDWWKNLSPEDLQRLVNEAEEGGIPGFAEGEGYRRHIESVRDKIRRKEG